MRAKLRCVSKYRLLTTYTWQPNRSNNNAKAFSQPEKAFYTVIFPYSSCKPHSCHQAWSAALPIPSRSLESISLSIFIRGLKQWKTLRKWPTSISLSIFIRGLKLQVANVGGVCGISLSIFIRGLKPILVQNANLVGISLSIFIRGLKRWACVRSVSGRISLSIFIRGLKPMISSLKTIYSDHRYLKVVSVAL